MQEPLVRVAGLRGRVNLFVSEFVWGFPECLGDNIWGICPAWSFVVAVVYLHIVFD